MLEENLRLRDYAETEATNDIEVQLNSTSADIIENDYNRRMEMFRQSLTHQIKPGLPKAELIARVVESAIVSEFSPLITKYSGFEKMKDSITEAMLKDPNLKEKILHLAGKYQHTA